MISYEMFCKIKDAKDRLGLNVSQIAKDLGLDPRTAHKWIDAPHFCPRKSSPRKAILDPFKSEIVRLLERFQYSAQQIFQKVKEEGFPGGYGSVKEYVNKVRPCSKAAFLKLSFAPGECAQVDWGSFGSIMTGETRRKLSFFVMTLCYSRFAYLEFTVSQTMEHFLSCHANAFEFFGCVPKRLMIDNLKSAVLTRILGEAPVFNPKYLDFARHYGFAIAPCNVGKGNEKGRVENGVGYVKKNFLAGLEIPCFAAMNPGARLWLQNVSNVRIHGETRAKPADMFNEEKSCLLPLPENRFDVATVSQVRASSQFRVALDSNKYSVPAEYAGQRLTLRSYPDRLCLYHDGKLVARHPRSYDRHKDFEDPDHPKELLLQRKRAKDQKIFVRFLALHHRADEYYKKLEERRMNAQTHVRKIVALSEIYPAELVSKALSDAFECEAFSSEYIANILESRSRLTPEAGALHLAHREDLLDISIEAPDLSIYQTASKDKGGQNGNGNES